MYSYFLVFLRIQENCIHYHCANNKKHNELVSKSDNTDKEKEDEDLLRLNLNKKDHIFCLYCNIDFTSKRNYNYHIELINILN